MTSAKASQKNKECKAINVKPQYDNKQKELKSISMDGVIKYQVTYNHQMVYLDSSLDDAISAYNKAGLLKVQNKNWYDSAPESWINATRAADMSAHYKIFLSNLDDSAHILDIGCGSGRDTKYFIDSGFNIISIDSSKKMCNLTKKYAGKKAKVLNIGISEIDECTTFDAVWAMASFVHMRENELRDTFDKINKILKPGGVFYTCLKQVETEYVDELGRTYPATSEKIIKELLANTGFVNIETYCTEDELGRDSKWINVLAYSQDYNLNTTPGF